MANATMNSMNDGTSARAQMEEELEQFLVFQCDALQVGVRVDCVVETLINQSITSLPMLPNYVCGIINLRGEIIPVMDVRLRFGKPEIPYNERTCIIVARTDSLCVGLIVDSVCEVVQLADENIAPPPKINGTSNRYIKSIGKVEQEIKLLLDFEKLVADEDFEGVVRAEASASETSSDS